MKITSHLSPVFNKSLGTEKVLIIDFNDSFTYNIASDLFELGIQSEVINVQDIEVDIESYILENNYKAYILGPGPGNPNDYFDNFNFIQKLSEKKIYVLGICLGHQILSLAKGYSLNKSMNPIHGSSEFIKFPETFFGQKIKIHVQRYNSLAIKNLDLPESIGPDILYNTHHEIIAMRDKYLLSYQFHPESIGTSCRKQLFQPLVDFLYNKIDEC
jgi:anthranilate/para-aminobenzoate synthase component II